MGSTTAAIPLLLSFALGLLAGYLMSDIQILPLRPTATKKPAPLVRDDFLWLLLFAAFVFGILLTVITSSLL